MQHRSAGPIDCTNSLLVKSNKPFIVRRRIISMEVEQSRPPSTNSQHLMPLIHGSVYHSLDTRVKSRHIPPTSQDANSHKLASPFLRLVLLKSTMSWRVPAVCISLSWRPREELAGPAHGQQVADPSTIASSVVHVQHRSAWEYPGNP